MAAGADSIDGLHVLRHGAMPAVFAGARAPSTLGTFLRAFTHGHALQLHAVHRRFLAALAAHTPLLPGSDELAFIDVDFTHKRVYGRAKQGAEYGRFTGIRTPAPAARHGLHPTTEAGERRSTDATRQGSRLPRRPEIRERGPGNRPRGRPHRDPYPAGRLTSVTYCSSRTSSLALVNGLGVESVAGWNGGGRVFGGPSHERGPALLVVATFRAFRSHERCTNERMGRKTWRIDQHRTHHDLLGKPKQN